MRGLPAPVVRRSVDRIRLELRRSELPPALLPPSAGLPGMRAEACTAIAEAAAGLPTVEGVRNGKLPEEQGDRRHERSSGKEVREGEVKSGDEDGGYGMNEPMNVRSCES